MNLCSWSAQGSYCSLSVVRVIQPVVGVARHPVQLLLFWVLTDSGPRASAALGSWETFMCCCLPRLLPIFGCCFLITKKLFIQTSTECFYSGEWKVSEWNNCETWLLPLIWEGHYSDLSVGHSELFRIWIKHIGTLFCNWILIRADKTNICLVSQVESMVPELPFFFIGKNLLNWAEQTI